MAICLDYQSIYCDRREAKLSTRVQILAVIILLSALAVRVWVKVETTNIGYELAEARSAAVELDMERRDLELQLSILLRPDELSKLARKRLDLRPLNPDQARRIVMAPIELEVVR